MNRLYRTYIEFYRSGNMKERNKFFYIGTYTDKSSRGIYGFRFDPLTGEHTAPRLIAEMVSPSYLTMNNSRSILYAVSEPTDGSKGAIAAFTVNPQNGELEKINQVMAPGKGLCHVLLDKKERYLFTACYPDATVQVYKLNGDGSIGDMTCIKQHFGQGVNPVRQRQAHAHATCMTPDQRYLCVCDLGIDQLVVYDFDPENGNLKRNESMTLSLPPGCGPRHVVFHPNGKYAYVIAELSSQVIVLSYDENRGFKIVQVIDALEDKRVSSIAAAIRIDKNGKHLYSSNRGEDSISHFKIDLQTGKLTHIGNTPTYGKTPRDFIIDESGRYLICANQDSDNVVIYDINLEDGKLLMKKEIKAISQPVCVVNIELE